MAMMHESEEAGNDSRADGSVKRELLRRYAREQDEAAFRALVERHLDLVYSLAPRPLGGDAHGAADIAQEVSTALARQAAKLPEDVVLPAWLHATTRHLTANRVRIEIARGAAEVRKKDPIVLAVSLVERRLERLDALVRLTSERRSESRRYSRRRAWR